MDKENKLILYKDDEGKVSVNVRFAEVVFQPVCPKSADFRDAVQS